MSVLIDRGFLHVLLLATAVPAFAQQTTWKDSSPHRVELVAVDGGVQLEVLDWRGSGPALVLLAGLGDTAHVFDDFAQALIPRHRVVGVTRRGFGRSSPSPSGYGFARLAEDVARVIATLGLDRPLVIGHSFGGLLVQMVAGRGIAAATVSIDPAPSRGVLPLPFSALRASFPVLGNPANRKRTVTLTFDEFRYGFANAVSEDEARHLYETFHTPAPGRPLFQAATANLDPRTVVRAEKLGADRGPMLVISGEKDNIVPWALANAAYKQQARNRHHVTEIVEIPGVGHSLVIDSHWGEVADASLAFLRARGL